MTVDAGIKRIGLLGAGVLAMLMFAGVLSVYDPAADENETDVPESLSTLCTWPSDYVPRQTSSELAQLVSEYVVAKHGWHLEQFFVELRDNTYTRDDRNSRGIIEFHVEHCEGSKLEPYVGGSEWAFVVEVDESAFRVLRELGYQ